MSWASLLDGFTGGLTPVQAAAFAMLHSHAPAQGGGSGSVVDTLNRLTHGGGVEKHAGAASSEGVDSPPADGPPRVKRARGRASERPQSSDGRVHPEPASSSSPSAVREEGGGVGGGSDVEETQTPAGGTGERRHGALALSSGGDAGLSASYPPPFEAGHEGGEEQGAAVIATTSRSFKRKRPAPVPSGGGHDGAGGQHAHTSQAGRGRSRESSHAASSSSSGAAGGDGSSPHPHSHVDADLRVHQAGPQSLHNKKHAWTAEEDETLRGAVARLEADVKEGKPLPWTRIDKEALVPGRNSKQCRDRYVQHLRGDIKKEAWSEAEDATLYAEMEVHGTAWSAIATAFPGRTDHDIKNHFYSTKRRLARKKQKERQEGGTHEGGGTD